MVEGNVNDDMFESFSSPTHSGPKIEKDFIDVLRMISPGTSLRIALDDLLRAKMGALIVFENDFTEPIIEGGFRLNTKFSAQKIVELSKMDGGIIMSKDGKKIISANVLLFPSISISTKETGTRHKAAQRTAKQAKTITIAVSERKNKISLYYGDIAYQLDSGSEILRRASETLQIVEKQRESFDKLIDNLNALELSRSSTINDVCLTIQRLEILKRISEVVKRYLIELGREGKIVKMRLKELMSGVAIEGNLILKDYFGTGSSAALEIMENMDFDFLLEPMNISRLLFEELHDKNISPKGIRLLGKTNMLERYVDLLTGNFKDLNEIISANHVELLNVLEGEAMVSFFREELYNLRERVNLGKRI